MVEGTDKKDEEFDAAHMGAVNVIRHYQASWASGVG